MENTPLFYCRYCKQMLPSHCFCVDADGHPKYPYCRECHNAKMRLSRKRISASSSEEASGRANLAGRTFAEVLLKTQPEPVRSPRARRPRLVITSITDPALRRELLMKALRTLQLNLERARRKRAESDLRRYDDEHPDRTD